MGNRCFVISLLAHVVILAIFVVGFEMTGRLVVFQNSNKNDVISAVVLGESPKSNIVTPQNIPTPPIPEPIQKVEKKPEPPKPKPVAKKNFFENDLLADIKKHSAKQKEVKQKLLKTHFEKTLRQQAEESLRQQMLDEDLKLQAEKAREAQGRVDRYTSLIVQAIQQHWVIPQGSKKLKGEIKIHLAPGGEVLDAQVVKSSGDVALDNSARKAVRDASPLPVPKNLDEFEAFRQFVIKFDPKEVRNA